MKTSKILILLVLFCGFASHAKPHTSFNSLILGEVQVLVQVQVQNKSTPETFKTRFNAIQNEFERQQNLLNAGEILESKYFKQLKKLRKKELKLFKAVKKYEFKTEEVSDYNFWYRGVFKFPTQIEQELSKPTSKE
ncbi:hypothetical protein F6U93_05620 [Tamlana haliotis]|uniref:Uncharacterized protein n=1 Tax=Pseudotamlana haliotis TaxID=2614804 RepID=A0A6N6MG34_9FLAO|nr:hypothetical protein [Tamlana haliotis]KAB1068791.1 hypothetical protein F6U93_05620 [Tamlana haliotis]